MLPQVFTSKMQNKRVQCDVPNNVLVKMLLNHASDTTCDGTTWLLPKFFKRLNVWRSSGIQSALNLILRIWSLNVNGMWKLSTHIPYDRCFFSKSNTIVLRLSHLVNTIFFYKINVSRGGLHIHQQTHKSLRTTSGSFLALISLRTPW